MFVYYCLLLLFLFLLFVVLFVGAEEDDDDDDDGGGISGISGVKSNKYGSSKNDFGKLDDAAVPLLSSGLSGWDNDDPLMALGFCGFDIENIIEFRRRPPLLPPDRLQFDYTNLLNVKPKDLRNESDWSFKYFADKYLSFFREVFDENFERDWAQAQCCGKTIIVIILVVLGTALYVVMPIIILYFLGSLSYPIICLLATPWSKVALLQKVLTFIYLSAMSILVILAPRVYKFQHANFHFIAVRESWWYSRSLDAPFQIQKRYVDLIATRIRNRMIATFFGDVSNEMMQFLPALHEVDEEWVEQEHGINVDYSPQFDARIYDYDKSYITVDMNLLNSARKTNDLNELGNAPTGLMKRTSSGQKSVSVGDDSASD